MVLGELKVNILFFNRVKTLERYFKVQPSKLGSKQLDKAVTTSPFKLSTSLPTKLQLPRPFLAIS
jgi:hypothetical protein